MNKITLVGMPNSGKSTLFNELTGLSAKIVNYPGSTVEVMRGQWHDFEVWDIPGVYSLNPSTEEEHIALQEIQKAELILLVLDMTQMYRQSQLLPPLLALGKPLVVVLTMEDLVHGLKVPFDISEWRTLSGIPAFLKSEILGPGGLEKLKHTFREWKSRGPQNLTEDRWQKLTAFHRELGRRLAVGVERWSLRWDRLILHPLWGLIIFIFAVVFLFGAAFWASQPISAAIEQAAAFLIGYIDAIPQEGMLSLILAFMTKALLPGLTSFLSFVPQIFFLFFVLHLFETSGYLARASLLTDALLKRIGLSGRSFIPLISGYGCAIPAILATRSLGSRREKTIVRWMLPLLTCSARVPVFVMIVEVVLRQQGPFLKALGLLFFYGLSFLVAGLAGAVVNRVLKQGVFSDERHSNTFLAMELPWYRRPLIPVAFRIALLKAWDFISRAGPIIFVASTLIYALSVLPVSDGPVDIRTSYLGRFAQVVDPIFKPMGADGDVGIALLTSFVAREVFVSTLATLRGVTEESVSTLSAEFLTFAQGVALGVFFLIALQCASTLVVLIKEGHGWRATLLQLVIYNGIAYFLAVVTYQVLH